MSYRCIILIPQGGCNGCIQEAEALYLRMKSDKTLLFIFTNYHSVKSLRIKLGKEIEKSDNVLLDANNLFYLPSYQNSIYPYAIFLSEGKVSHFADIEELQKFK